MAAPARGLVAKDDPEIHYMRYVGGQVGGARLRLIVITGPNRNKGSRCGRGTHVAEMVAVLINVASLAPEVPVPAPSAARSLDKNDVCVTLRRRNVL